MKIKRNKSVNKTRLSQQKKEPAGLKRTKKSCFWRGELNENSTIHSRSDQKVQLLTTKSQAMQVILSIIKFLSKPFVPRCFRVKLISF